MRPFVQRRIVLLVVLAGIETTIGTGQALQRAFPMRNTVELGGSVGFSRTARVAVGRELDHAVIQFTAAPYVGYFVADGLELGVNPAEILLQTQEGSGITQTQIRILFAPSYNFRASTMVTPFVEALAGFTSSTTSDANSSSTLSGLSWGGRGGVKLAVAEHSLLNLAVQYLQITLSPSGAAERSGMNELSIQAGWTVWL